MLNGLTARLWVLFGLLQAFAYVQCYVTLSNSKISVVIDDNKGLTSLEMDAWTLDIFNDEFDVVVILDDAHQTSLILNTSVCSASSPARQETPLLVSQSFDCDPGNFVVQVEWFLQTDDSEYISKQLKIQQSQQIDFVVETMSLFGSNMQLSAHECTSASAVVHSNSFNANGGQIAAFARFGASGTAGINHGAFVSVTNPFTTFAVKPVSATGIAISASYDPQLRFEIAPDNLYHLSDEGVIGLTQLGQYTLQFGNDIVYQTERQSFIACVEEHYADHSSRVKNTVKVNVAWDESDYQIDVGTAAGQTEYKRIIDRNSQFGVTHIVYEPANSLHSSRFNTTDGWGWEGGLWFSMGELLREGKWDPIKDDVPEDIMNMITYAESKNVKFMAYVYPCLAFEAVKQYFNGTGVNKLDLSHPQVQSWMIQTMIAFQTKTKSGGWAWDHDIYTYEPTLQYGQWRGWMRILAALRKNNPDIVMDHRQTAHRWGPWYHIAGSYSEPIAGDENPETYGVPIASLHTDHVAADNTRIVNFNYAIGQLIPPSRVPGFIFHQTERTADNGTNPCFSSSKLCYDSNVRDFDLLGYKYSLMSTIGTAGLNNVLTMIPARDEEEFSKFPKEDLDYIHNWLAWTDANIGYLQNTAPIASLGPPTVGSVDGTCATMDDEGYIFLFNPGYQNQSAVLTVDEAIGLSNASRGQMWEVIELYPNAAHPIIATWSHGANVTVPVGGSDARVLQLVKKTTDTTSNMPSKLVSTKGQAKISGEGFLEVTNVSGATGSTDLITVEGVVNQHIKGVAVNGRLCTKFSSEIHNTTITTTVSFGGDTVFKNMPISPAAVVDPGSWKGGWLNTSFDITQPMVSQLKQRAQSYPIHWDPADYRATWLVQTRLLMYFFVVKPSDTMPVQLIIDGHEATAVPAYNSRGLKRSRCFLGFYYDATNLTVSSHTVNLNLPSGAQFEGIFWENLETQYTQDITYC